MTAHERTIKRSEYIDVEKTMVLERIADRHEASLKGYTQHLVSNFPNIRDYKSLVSYGSFQWTVHHTKEKEGYKLLREANAIALPNGANPCAPSSLARLYLETLYSERQRKAVGAQVRSISQKRPMPLFVQPAVFSEGVYIDTVSAWYSILQLVGWDCDYYPAGWLVSGRPTFDFPLPDNKLARNCLVSGALPTPKFQWTGTQFRERQMHNKFINLGLWAVIADTLHALAFEAVSCGACYVHTDGYIVPRNRAAELIERIRAYGLTARAKYEGSAVVMGFANWMVGEHKAANWGAYSNGTYTNLQWVDQDWLRQRLNHSRNSMVAKWGIS